VEKIRDKLIIVLINETHGIRILRVLFNKCDHRRTYLEKNTPEIPVLPSCRKHACGYPKNVSFRDTPVNSCADQWAALFEHFCLIYNVYQLFRELFKQCVLIPEDGRVLTGKLAQLIR